MQPTQRGSCYMVAAFWYSTACQWENGFGCGNWGRRFLLPRAFTALVRLGIVSTGSGLTGFLPITLLTIAAFYQTKNRICMNDYSMLKNFLNQSQVSGLDLAVASYWVPFQNVLGCGSDEILQQFDLEMWYPEFDNKCSDILGDRHQSVMWSYSLPFHYSKTGTGNLQWLLFRQAADSTAVGKVIS